MITKSNGRQEQEKAIMDKIQNIFDNAEVISNFDILVHGAYDEVTTITYRVEERIRPKEDKQ